MNYKNWNLKHKYYNHYSSGITDSFNKKPIEKTLIVENCEYMKVGLVCRGHSICSVCNDICFIDHGYERAINRSRKNITVLCDLNKCL